MCLAQQFPVLWTEVHLPGVTAWTGRYFTMVTWDASRIISIYCHISMHWLCTFLCSIILKSVWTLPTFTDVVYSLSKVWLFVTPWIAARQASLSLTVSWNLLKLMSFESVVQSNHLMFCCHLHLPSLTSVPDQHQGLFQWIGSSHQVDTSASLQMSCG